MGRATGLNITNFTIAGTDYKALLQTGSIGSQMDQVQTEGIADLHQFNQNVKAAHSLDFDVLEYVSGGPNRATSLNITLWSIGSDYLGDLKSGSVNVSIPTVDGEGAAVFDKIPIAVGGRSVEISTKLMIITGNAAHFTGVAMGGTIADFDVAVDIGYNGKSITVPMLLSAAKHSWSRGQLQLEDVTLKLKGTPTAPIAGAGLLGAAILGTLLVVVDVVTGANEYAAPGGEGISALITKMMIAFDDGKELRTSGTLLFQGAPTVTAPA